MIRRLNLLRNLRTFLMGFVVIGIIVCLGGLYYLNQIGLTYELRTRVSQELEKQGIYADFESLKLDLVRGIIAQDISLFRSAESETAFSHFEQMIIGVDKTKALRGIIRIERLAVKGGSLSVPLAPTGEKSSPSDLLELSEINGRFNLYSRTLLDLKTLTGRVGGIDVEIKGLIDLPRHKASGTNKEEGTPDAALSVLARQITGELSQWDFTGAAHPLLRINCDGPIDQPQRLSADFQLTAPLLRKDNYTIEDFSLSGIVDGRQITITALRFTDKTGTLECSGSYDLSRKEGTLAIDSSLHLQQMIRSAFEQEIAPDLVIRGASDITGEASFSLRKGGPSVQVTGKTSAKDLTFRGLSFSSASSEFSWDDGDFFLRDISCQNPRGSLNGRLLFKDDQLRYRFDCSLPLDFFRSAFPNKIVQRIVDRFEFKDATTSLIQADGTHSLSDGSFDLVGGITMENFIYRGIPMKELKTDFVVDQSAVDLRHIRLGIDFAESPWKKRYGGPADGLMEGERVVVDISNQLVRITNARGKAWPQLVVGLFSPKTNRFIDPYRFHSPPSMVGNGVFDMEHPPLRTDFQVKASIPGRTDYDFIGEALPLQDIETSLRFLYRKTNVPSLRANLFEGPIRFNLEVVTPKESPKQISGHIDWTQLSMARLAKTYDIGAIDSGDTTGRFDFSLQGEDLTTLRGAGNVGLQKTKLFSVPVFGPLSPLMSGLLQDKRAGYERAKNASLTFTARKGILYFSDFSATTSSLVFTGDGEVDLPKESFRMTIRMNGRGILRLLKIPLAPLMGLFQFTGTGPLDKPVWRNTPYTRPPDEENLRLMREPPKAEIVEEP